MVTYIVALIIACSVIVSFEKSPTPVRPLVQLLALAVLGRWMFMAIPSVQPSTALLMLTALYIGWTSAAVLALFVPLLSGLILGIGPFVLYQFLGWLLVVSLTYLLRPVLLRSTMLLSGLGLLAGFVFGWTTNLSFLEIIGVDFIKIGILSFPLDLAHGISNVFFLILIQPLFRSIITKQLG